jgi:hypothetical protein
MHKVALAAVLGTLAIGAALTAAQADNYYGPRKQGNLCWRHQTGNSLGYWAPCPQAQSAARGRTGRTGTGTSTAGQGGGAAE